MVLALVTLVVLALGLSVAAQQVQATRIFVDRIDDHSRLRLDTTSQRNRLIYALVKNRDLQSNDIDGLIGRSRNAQSRDEPDLDALKSAFSAQLEFDDALFAQSLPLSPTLRAMVIQDTGLIDINAHNENYLEFIAEKLGAERSQNTIAKLRDFIDEDNRIRFGGAEQSSYGTNVDVPNAPLRHRDDVCAVQGWSGLPVCLDARQRAMFLIAGVGSLLVIEHGPQPLQSTLLGELTGRQNATSEWFRQAGREGFSDTILTGSRGDGTVRMIFEFADQPDAFGVATVRILPSVSQRPFEVRETDILSTVRAAVPPQ